MKRRLLYTILSISLLTVMAGAAIAPALGVISAHFEGRNPLFIQLIVSLPALFIILTNLVFPWLCRLMKTRTLALTGLALYVLSGAGAFFVDNIWMLLVFRALMGVSVGMPTAIAARGGGDTSPWDCPRIRQAWEPSPSSPSSRARPM